MVESCIQWTHLAAGAPVSRFTVCSSALSTRSVINWTGGTALTVAFSACS